MITIIGAII